MKMKRRGSTLILVLFVVSVSTLIVVSLQMSAYRQAASGRETLGYVRAKWAARAGVEQTIAYLEWTIDQGDFIDPMQFQNKLEELAHGKLNTNDGFLSSEFHIQHQDGYDLVDGPADPHAKLNVNLISQEALLMLDEMTEPLAAAIVDWIDTDSRALPGGAEAPWYINMPIPLMPRNGPIRDLQELDLIEGVEPEMVRGEDWNLNGIADPNERDGELSWPIDNEDNYLDAGWSRYLTASSYDSTMGTSGQPKLILVPASLEEIQSRIGVDAKQAEALKKFAQNRSNRFHNLLYTRLSTVNSTGRSGGENLIGATDLTDDQMRTLFAEATDVEPDPGTPGKLNLNAAPRELIEMLPNIGPTIADRIDQLRINSPDGIESLVDLLAIQGMTPQRLAQLAQYVDVQSHTLVFTSRGVAQPGRAQVELVVTIDRSSLPIRIVDYLER